MEQGERDRQDAGEADEQRGQGERDRAVSAGFGGRTPDECAVVSVPVLIIPGDDERHPATVAARVAQLLPQGSLASVGLDGGLRDAQDLADAIAPVIRDYLGAP